MPIKPLKLYARDGDDMEVISACLQDSVAQIGDMVFLKEQQRFVMLVNRFCWEQEAPMRVRAALQISGVGSIQQRQLNLTRRDGIVSVWRRNSSRNKARLGLSSWFFRAAAKSAWKSRLARPY